MHIYIANIVVIILCLISGQMLPLADTENDNFYNKLLMN